MQRQWVVGLNRLDVWILFLHLMFGYCSCIDGNFILVVKLLTVSWTEIGGIVVELFHFGGEMV